MRIGYSRAARLVEAMEVRSIVGPSENTKAREVRISAAESHRLFPSDGRLGPDLRFRLMSMVPAANV